MTRLWLLKWLAVLVFLLPLSIVAQTVSATQPQLNVVATTSNMGMLARTVGGDAVNVTVLAAPDRDAHYLQVRPSMMAAIRRADLVVAVGAELEIGWLPPAIQGGANPRVNPGQPGYFEAARSVQLIDAGQPADRSLGDVHPQGNPHIYLDPIRMSVAAEALAEHMADLRPALAGQFRANALKFSDTIDERMPDWLARTTNAPGVLFFHADGNYMARRFGVPVYGTIEPLPGIPPSASHLNDLVKRLSGETGVIMYAVYDPPAGPEFLGRQLGWPRHALPHNVPLNDLSAEAYFVLIDNWVEAFSPEN
jgi:zinc/manganese transport system substrate-binding protein